MSRENRAILAVLVEASRGPKAHLVAGEIEARLYSRGYAVPDIYNELFRLRMLGLVSSIIPRVGALVAHYGATKMGKEVLCHAK